MAAGCAGGEARLRVTTGVVAHCAGSAMAEVGASKVVCSVRGPAQLLSEYRGGRGKVVVSVRLAGTGVCGQAAQHGAAQRERELVIIAEGVCEQVVLLQRFPQLSFDVAAVVVQGTGGESDMEALCAALCAALVHAGVELEDMFCAATASMGADGCIGVLPRAEAARSATAACTVVAGCGSGRVLFVSHRGSAQPAAMGRMVSAAVEGCVRQRAALCAQL